MGNGGSKTESVHDGSRMSQETQGNASTRNVQLEAIRIDEKYGGSTQAVKRQHSPALEPERVKKLKRSDSHEVVQQDETTSAPNCSPGNEPGSGVAVIHRRKESPTLPIATSSDEAWDSDEKEETGSSRRSALPHPVSICQGESSAHTKTPSGSLVGERNTLNRNKGSSEEQPQAETQYFDSTSQVVQQSFSINSSTAHDDRSPGPTPCSPSQQMSGQPEQASQALQQAAAASQDLEDAPLAGWTDAPFVVTSPEQREQNREQLRKATERIREIKDSRLFSKEVLTQSTTQFQSIQRLLGQKRYASLRSYFSDHSDKSPEVNFIVETGTKPPKFAGQALPQRAQEEHRHRNPRLHAMREGDRRKLKEPRTGMPRRPKLGKGLQRKLRIW